MNLLILFILGFICNSFSRIVDVNIEAAGSAYPRRIQIQKGDTIRFHNKITQNRVEHTITPDKAGNSHLWFGGLSFYASNLGGLYVSYLQIDGIGQGPFFTQNWPEAEFKYFCQFHGGTEQGVIIVGNGAGREPTKPADIVTPEKQGCIADESLCAIKKPATCQDADILLKESGFGHCEPIPGSDNYDGVCKWGTRSTYNCFEIDFKTCLNGVCVDPPPMPTNPTTLSECSESTKLFDCTAFPAPTCRDATTLAYVQDASQVSCTDAEVQGIFKCRYNLVRYDCATLNGAVCSNGACVQGSTSVSQCSAQFPKGSCPPGTGLCQNGVCTTQTAPCSPQCTNGQICKAGTCQTSTIPANSCSPSNLSGECPSPQICKAPGNCQNPVAGECSSAEPTGSCPSGFSCQAGACKQLSNACTPSNPTGDCDVPNICQQGQCVSPSCSASNPTGSCASGYTCTQGSCTATGTSTGPPVSTACSATQPCLGDNQCVNGRCQAPSSGLCSPTSPGGSCSNANERCVNGACKKCSLTAAACKLLNDACWKPIECGCDSAPPCPTQPSNAPCSSTNLSGVCSSSVQKCENGVCVALSATELPCSSVNTQGVCATAGQKCLSNGSGHSCQTVCSNDAPSGVCETAGFTCTAQPNTGGTVHACQGAGQAPKCSPSNPQGPCPVGQQCQPAAGGGYLCSAPTQAPASPSGQTCNITPELCRLACSQSSVKSCNCQSGTTCHPLSAIDESSATTFFPTLLITFFSTIITFLH